MDIIANSGIAAPVAAGVNFTDALTVWLAGSGQITYTIASNNGTVDNGGTTAQSGAILSDVSSWGGSGGSCTAVPSVPGTPSGTGTSSSTISVTWGASTAGSGCTVSYNLFRSTTSGFTPSSTNQIASGLTSASFADSGLTASTTYYYVVEAADGDGPSAASAQGSGKTQTANTAPVITTQPVAQSVTVGQTATFSVVATGTPAPTYQWYKNSAAISGATAATYTTPATVATDNGSTFYVVVTNSVGSVTSNTFTLTVTSSSCGAVTAAPAGLAVTATTSSSVSLSWTAPTPPANCTVSSYIVYDGTASPPTAVAGTPAGTTYTVTGLAASTTYYFSVASVDAFGTSAASTPISDKTSPPSVDFIAIAAGGPAESDASGGDANFVADVDFSGGGDASSTTHTINLTQPGVNAAPMGVYQHARAGVTTYTIPGMTAGSQHAVLLHFSENYFTAAGKRVFNVAINGTTVLSDFDIYKTAGAKYTAIVETFTATTNSSGDIVIAFTDGTANQPEISGIEIR